MEEGFQTLKKLLVSAPVLGYADFTKPFVLEIDASHAGLGAILSRIRMEDAGPLHLQTGASDPPREICPTTAPESWNF